ncbi:MAG: MFS transporter [Candidatus Brocadiaceae bacterium]|nr:MFS transporter [Candidatus Brocadiaceae bacterium]
MAASTIGIICSAPGQTIGVSAFTDSLIEVLHVSRVQLTTAYLIGTAASGFLLPWGGRLYDRLGSRLMFVASALLLGMILLFLSAIDTATQAVSSLLGSETTHSTALGLLIISFLLLRFSGQGMMTMISRNMVGKWFHRRLGTVSGITGVAISGGFTGSIYVFNYCVQSFGWKKTWFFLGLTMGLGIAFFGWLFYRDNPEECGLIKDEFLNSKNPAVETSSPAPQIAFTLRQAQRTIAFWAVTIALSIQALAITGITFHINSIGHAAGKSIQESISLFPPVMIISIIAGVVVGWSCARAPLKYLIMIMMIFQLLGFFGMTDFGTAKGHWMATIGLGVSGGFFGPLSTVAIPHFFGLKHLGAISGKMTSGMVVASGLGPLLLAWSVHYQESYNPAFYLFMLLPFILFFVAFKANHPQAHQV